jgi:transcriptional regulator with XRE-family HTH domain
MASTAERIRELRLESGRTESELAAALGLTPDAYANLERFDSEIDSTLSISQALQLAGLLGTHIVELMGEGEAPGAAVPIAKVRAALAAQIARSPDSREALEDAVDWDLGPFLEAVRDWPTVYTLDFLRRLAALVDIDWRRLLAGLERP